MKISCSKYIILLLILPFYVLFAYQSIAEITNVIGQVYCSNHRGNSDCYRYDDAQKLIVHSGKSLHEGDKIFVMQKGKANIVFRNGNTIKQINGEIEIDPDEVTIENGFFQGFFKMNKSYLGDSFFTLNSKPILVRIKRGEFFFKFKENTYSESKSTDLRLAPGIYLEKGEAEVYKKGDCFIGFLLCEDTIMLKEGEKIVFRDFQVTKMSQEELSQLHLMKYECSTTSPDVGCTVE
ncbi:MAG: hypothetical protein H7A23_09085 [Leptospiraceae bacterium]|nr:hypothetical protein [Leptospiraceae bacterium]MCP5494696.1 hypothetical protein [Leptospiraceae bacterium]